MNRPHLNVVNNKFSKVSRYEIFKGQPEGNANIIKVRTLGVGLRAEDRISYLLHLNTLVKDIFYLFPSRKGETSADYTIMTRIATRNGRRKFIWKPVGEGWVVSSEKSPLVRLAFDLFLANDIYMSLEPMKPSFESQAIQTLKEVM